MHPSDLEREVSRLKDDNGRLQEQLLIEKTHFLDVESFAKEQLAGNNPEEILQRYSTLTSVYTLFIISA